MALCLKQVFNKDKTFRPRKKFEPGTQRFELYKKAQASLKSGLDLKAVVQLPPGESINDWIAVHVVDFFNRINLIYGTMSEYCTEKSCPIMSGGLKYEYRWQDDNKYKKPTKLSAPKYMCMLMDWIEMLINNEDIFPTRIGECALVLCKVSGVATSAGSQAAGAPTLGLVLLNFAIPRIVAFSIPRAPQCLSSIAVLQICLTLLLNDVENSAVRFCA